MWRGFRLVTAIIAVSMGCASAPAASSRDNGNVITSEEIAKTSGSNAYEIIQRLRPNYLRTRGAVHGAPSGGVNRLETVDLVVYLNDSRFGGSDQLRQISVNEIREIRYYNAAEATTKWGTGHSAGAIQVISR
jgi:hypothetical protein